MHKERAWLWRGEDLALEEHHSEARQRIHQIICVRKRPKLSQSFKCLGSVAACDKEESGSGGLARKVWIHLGAFEERNEVNGLGAERRKAVTSLLESAWMHLSLYTAEGETWEETGPAVPSLPVATLPSPPCSPLSIQPLSLLAARIQAGNRSRPDSPPAHTVKSSPSAPLAVRIDRIACYRGGS